MWKYWINLIKRTESIRICSLFNTPPSVSRGLTDMSQLFMFHFNYSHKASQISTLVTLLLGVILAFLVICEPQLSVSLFYYLLTKAPTTQRLSQKLLLWDSEWNHSCKRVSSVSFLFVSLFSLSCCDAAFPPGGGVVHESADSAAHLSYHFGFSKDGNNYYLFWWRHVFPTTPSNNLSSCTSFLIKLKFHLPSSMQHVSGALQW